MRTLSTALVCTLLCILLAATAVGGAPDSGRLAFASAPTLDGDLSAEGPGELHLRDVGARVQGSAAKVEVTRVWHEITVLHNPLGGGPVSSDTSEVRREVYNFSDADFALSDTADGFEMLIFSDEDGRISMPSTPVEAFLVEAYANPRLVVDPAGGDDHVHDDERVFTWESDGARFPLGAGHFSVDATHTLYVGAATFDVVADGKATKFRSGTERTDTSPTSHREANVYHLIKVQDGVTTVDAADAVAWFAGPTLDLDGTLTSTAATGSIQMDDDRYTLEAVPVTMGGAITLTPEPVGAPQPKEREDLYIGTRTYSGGAYSGTTSPVDGELTVLAIGPDNPYMAETDLAVAASVGVLTLVGAVLLLTPHGKWAVLTIIAPFYAKTERDRLLDNESRDRIFQAIRNNPGINLSQIHRLADLGWGVTVYHLKMMEKNGLVFAETSARDKCFFENDPKFRALRTAISAIANRESAQRIAEAVVAHPGLSQRDLIGATGLTQRTVSYYVSRLTRQDLLETTRDGNFTRYRPTEPLVDALRMIDPAVERLDVTGPALTPTHQIEA